MNNIELKPGTRYWFVLRMQDDGNGSTQVSVSTDGLKAHAGNSGILGAVEQSYGINYKIFTAPARKILGAYRFNKEDTVNNTLVAIGDTMYVVDETSHTLNPLISGLNASAKDYSFANADGRVFWANGYDDLTSWDGTLERSNPNLITNPSFSTDTAGWKPVGSTALSRTTSDYKTAPAGMQLSSASGVRGASFILKLDSNVRYKMSYWVKGVTATGNTYVTYNSNTSAVAGTTSPVTTSWVKKEFYIAPGSDIASIQIMASSDNIIIDDVSIISTGIEYIKDSELPILREVCYSKARLFGVSASEKNKIVFSEAPGNPSNKPPREQWYRQWRSVSFMYIPRPKNGSPITGIIPFQDQLVMMEILALSASFGFAKCASCPLILIEPVSR